MPHLLRSLFGASKGVRNCTERSRLVSVFRRLRSPVLFAVIVLTGCGHGRFAKFWHGNRPPVVVDPGQWQRCCTGIKGYRWENEVFRSVVWRSQKPTERAEERIEGVYVSMARDVAGVVWAMQQRGARFDVTINHADRLTLTMLTPPRAETVHGPLVSSVNQRLSDLTDRQIVDEIERILAMLPLHEDMLENDELYDVENLLFFTVEHLAEVRGGKELKLTFPQGTSRESYETLLGVSLVRLGADYHELQSFRAAMAAVRLAFASLDDQSESSAANIAAIVDAVLADRDHAGRLRDAALSDYPRNQRDVARFADQGELIFAEVEASERYREWSTKNHDVENGKRFSRQVGNAFQAMAAGLQNTALSAPFGVVTNSVGAQRFDLGLMLSLARDQAPGGSRLGQLLKRARVQRVVPVRRGMPEDPAMGVCDAPPRTVDRLVLLHSPQEIRAVQQRLVRAR